MTILQRTQSIGASEQRSWFDPSTIAVVGASNRSGSAGTSYLRALLDDGRHREVWVVHPSGEGVLGQRAFADVASLPTAPDLAIVAVPAALVPSTVEQLAAAGCRAVHVFSGGFAELGTEAGFRAQQGLASAAGPVAILGPNCMGIHRPSSGLRFRADLPLLAGPVAIASQSGGVTINLIQLLAERGIGTSAAVSFGNCVNRGAAYWAEAVAALPDSGPLVVYVESAGEADLADRLARLAVERPIFFLRPEGDDGWTAAARRHTAAPGGFRLPEISGASVVHDLVELTDRLELAVRGRTVHAGGPVFITISGGMGVHVAGALGARGSALEPLPADLADEIARLEPSGLIAAANPVDLGPRFLSRRLLSAAVEAIHVRVSSRPIVVHLPWDSIREIETVQPGFTDRFLELLAALSVSAGVIVYFPRLGLDGEDQARRTLRTAGVPVIATTGALTPTSN